VRNNTKILKKSVTLRMPPFKSLEVIETYTRAFVTVNLSIERFEMSVYYFFGPPAQSL